MLYKIYNALIEDEYIIGKVGNRIKFYEYPEAKDMTATHIIIDPLDIPKPGDFADNKWLTDDYLLQIDVWSKNIEERNIIAGKIREVLWNKLNLKQLAGGVDEYNKELDIFRDARRYRGKQYNENLNRSDY